MSDVDLGRDPATPRIRPDADVVGRAIGANRAGRATEKREATPTIRAASVFRPRAIGSRIQVLAIVLCASSIVCSAHAAPKDKTDLAVERAVKFLLTKQNPEDGSFSDKPANRTAITSLAVIAMAAAGNQPTDATPAGRAMTRAIRYVIGPERQDDAGCFGTKDGSRMYGHGMTTLMLAEVLGQGTDDATDQVIRARLTKAVDLTLRAQQVPRPPEQQGGWRYTADTAQSDISVSVWQLLSLRAAKNAGIAVPAKAIDDAVNYINRCYAGNFDAAPAPAGGDPEAAASPAAPPRVPPPADARTGFGYTIGSTKYMSTSTTAMGLLSLELCGQYESPAARGAAGWLDDNPPAWGNTWLFYGAYYYAQAMYQRGGARAERAGQLVPKLLLPEQRPDGSWESGSEKEREVGPVFTTSLGVLALSVKYHYLPIYQR